MPLIAFLFVTRKHESREGEIYWLNEIFHIFYPLHLVSSCRPQSRGWDHLAVRAAWGASCWSLTWCHWWEPWLCTATVSACPWGTLLFSFTKTNYSTGPCLLLVIPSTVFPVGGWPCPWRTSKLWFKGSEPATGQTAATLKRLPACIAPEHAILPSTPWENILTQAFIGDHSPLPIY